MIFTLIIFILFYRNIRIFRCGFTENLPSFYFSGKAKEDIVDVTVTRAQFLRKFKTICPEYIVTKDLSKTNDFGNKIGSLAVKITLTLDDSWLRDPPLEEGETKGAGKWTDNVHKFPSGLSHMVPTFENLEKKALPLHTPLFFERKELEDLLAWSQQAGPNKKMIFDGKVSLDQMVFDQSSCAIDNKFSYSVVDSICRDSLRETLLAEQFTDILKDKFTKILEDWEEVSKDVDSLRSTLEEARDMLTLISPSLGRSRQLQTGLFVSNKQACRQYVLDQFEGHTDTKSAMMGSSFVSPSLFGPIPESLKRRLETSSFQANESYRLKFSKSKNQKNVVNNTASSSKRQRTIQHSPQVSKKPRREQPFSAYQDYYPPNPRPSQGYRQVQNAQSRYQRNQQYQQYQQSRGKKKGGRR